MNSEDSASSKPLSYYERNREAIKEKALARYYKKIGREPPRREDNFFSPEDLLDIKELVAQLRLLLSKVE
jgi:hypothetical protein